jgi:hypothetical protein
VIEVRKARADLGQGWADNRPGSRVVGGRWTCCTLIEENSYVQYRGISHIYGNEASLLYARGARIAGGMVEAAQQPQWHIVETTKFENKFLPRGQPYVILEDGMIVNPSQ